MKAYYVTGSLMVLAAIIIMLAVPVAGMIGEARAWDVVLGAVLRSSALAHEGPIISTIRRSYRSNGSRITNG